MRLFKLILPSVLVLSLSACAGTWNGVKNDAQGVSQWVSGKPESGIAREIAPVPTGYYGQNRRKYALLKPAPLREGESKPSDASVSWNDMGDYDSSYQVGQSSGQSSRQRYNGDVDVFFIDGDGDKVSDYAVMSSYQYNVVTNSGNKNANAAVKDNGSRVSGYDVVTPYSAQDGDDLDAYGRMAQKLYFPYGSAVINPADKSQLHYLASTIKDADGVSVTVVGHASKLVKGVNDPVRRKRINFAIAQKRSDEVTRELKNAGVRPGFVHSVTRGESEANDSVPQGMNQEAADRRVEVYIDEQ